MAKYTFDVSFDIPADVLQQIPQDNPLDIVSAHINKDLVYLTRFDRSEDPADECSSVRINCEGSDSWCQKMARRLTLTVQTSGGPVEYKNKGFEIVHCQS